MAGQRNYPDPEVDWESEKYVQGVIRHIRKMTNTTENDVRATGFKIVSLGRGFSPVRTGFMKNNITMEEGRDAKGFFVAILCRARYWKWVEFGHHKPHSQERVPAQPFMRPAFVLGLIYLRERALKRRAS